MTAEPAPPMPLLTAAAIFCDDIRFEQSGQVSLIGQYPGIVRLDAFPADIRRLFVFLRLRIPAALVPKSQAAVSLRATFDDSFSDRLDLQDSVLASAASGNDQPDQAVALDGAAHFTIDGLAVPEPGDLVVVLHLDGAAYEIDRLRIAQRPISQPA